MLFIITISCAFWPKTRIRLDLGLNLLGPPLGRNSALLVTFWQVVPSPDGSKGVVPECRVYLGEICLHRESVELLDDSKVHQDNSKSCQIV